MNQMAIISLVALLGWLILMIASYRSYNVGIGKTLRMILVWLVIFIVAAFVGSLLT